MCHRLVWNFNCHRHSRQTSSSSCSWSVKHLNYLRKEKHMFALLLRNSIFFVLDFCLFFFFSGRGLSSMPLRTQCCHYMWVVPSLSVFSNVYLSSNVHVDISFSVLIVKHLACITIFWFWAYLKKRVVRSIIYQLCSLLLFFVCFFSALLSFFSFYSRNICIVSLFQKFGVYTRVIIFTLWIAIPLK